MRTFKLRLGDVFYAVDLVLDIFDNLVKLRVAELVVLFIKGESEDRNIDIDIEGLHQRLHRVFGKQVHILHHFVVELEVRNLTVLADVVLDVYDTDILFCDTVDILHTANFSDFLFERLDDDVFDLFWRSTRHRHDHCTATDGDLGILFARHDLQRQKPHRQDEYC